MDTIIILLNVVEFLYFSVTLWWIASMVKQIIRAVKKK